METKSVPKLVIHTKLDSLMNYFYEDSTEPVGTVHLLMSAIVGAEEVADGFKVYTRQCIYTTEVMQEKQADLPI